MCFHLCHVVYDSELPSWEAACIAASAMEYAVFNHFSEKSYIVPINFGTGDCVVSSC